MNRKFMLELEINNYLDDIKNYADGAFRYMTAPETINDKDEILYNLAAVDEVVKIINELIGELEEEYENEQLQ